MVTNTFSTHCVKMAVQNPSNSVININCLEICKNRVYINPKFNRSQKNDSPSNAIMHVNPKFSHLVSNVQGNIQNKNKIYVNPIFIKAKSVSETTINNDIIVDNDNQMVVNTSNKMATHQQQSVVKEISPLQVPIAQSRYRLVRQNATNNVSKTPVPDIVKNTFKLNKYKSVAWNYFKTNLDTDKNNTNSSLTSRSKTNFVKPVNKKYLCSSLPNASKNDFKLINYNNISLLKQDKTKTKIYKIEALKKTYKSNTVSQPRMKKVKGNLKKNNIPCPLFRKFGKCLRNTRGGCDFLHDKKHVSICRKFIKGLCHDKDCLLSHDLTTKKMPTCYFYLQGTCTKTDCPYLHVKLNEKAKACPDFLKGYCEKGSKCLLRHIGFHSEKNNKRASTFTESSFKNKYNEVDANNYTVNNFDRRDKEVPQNIKMKGESAKLVLLKDENHSEYRYYQEHEVDESTNEACEIIKPMRCKLGTLPAFIQL